MKKTIAILFLALTILLSGCSNTSVSYKYADNWKAPSILADDGYAPDDEFYAHCTRMEQNLSLYSSVIYLYFRDLDFDWDNFANVGALNIVGPKDADDWLTMSVRLRGMMSSYAAMYNDDTKEIYLFPPFFEADEDLQMHALAHEMFHGLISTNHQNYTRLEEGLVDYYTCKFMQIMGREPQCGYLVEFNAIQGLIAIFGEEQVLSATRAGELNLLIDGATKPGMGDKLDKALLTQTFMLGTEEFSDAVNVEIDILVHAACQQTITAEFRDWLDYTELLNNSIGAQTDNQYFASVLSQALEASIKNLSGSQSEDFFMLE